MRTVTERLTLGSATTAQSDRFLAAEIEWIPGRIAQSDRACQKEWPIVANVNFDFRHGNPDLAKPDEPDAAPADARLLEQMRNSQNQQRTADRYSISMNGLIRRALARITSLSAVVLAAAYRTRIFFSCTLRFRRRAISRVLSVRPIAKTVLCPVTDTGLRENSGETSVAE